MRNLIFWIFASQADLIRPRFREEECPLVFRHKYFVLSSILKVMPRLGNCATATVIEIISTAVEPVNRLLVKRAV